MSTGASRIDDADNDVFLPEQSGAHIPSLEKANAHSPIHTRLYHLEVAARLSGRRTEPAAAGRAELQGMRADMIAGKNHLPRGDASLLLAGSLVLSQKAVDGLGPFLAQFGQLLEAKVDGAVEYFYNVTRVIDCIDPERSENRSSGSFLKEAFRTDALPVGPTVFRIRARCASASMPTH